MGVGPRRAYGTWVQVQLLASSVDDELMLFKKLVSAFVLSGKPTRPISTVGIGVRIIEPAREDD